MDSKSNASPTPGRSFDPEALEKTMKDFEARETARTSMPGLPLILRLDGRSFSKLTAKLGKPFDARLVQAFDAVAADLVEEFRPTVAYTQSDEITLAFLPPEGTSELPFGGRLQKLCSVVAARASSKLTLECSVLLPDLAKRCPTFDCRAFNVPTPELAAACILWRELDAAKNSLSMLASTLYPHKQLMGAGSAQRKDLCREAGQPWEDLPDGLKRGRFIRRTTVLRDLTEQERARIPEKHRPSGPVERSQTNVFTLPRLSKIENLVGTLFFAETPKQSPTPQQASAAKPQGT